MGRVLVWCLPWVLSQLQQCPPCLSRFCWCDCSDMIQARSVSFSQHKLNQMARGVFGVPPPFLSHEDCCLFDQCLDSWLANKQQQPLLLQIPLSALSKEVLKAEKWYVNPPAIVSNAVMPMQFLSPSETRMMCVHVS